MTPKSLSNILLGFMLSESVSMLDKAKAYRVEMKALAPGDSSRPIYEQAILFLLSRSRSLSSKVMILTLENHHV